MWIKILCIEYILRGIPTIESTFDVANMVKTATMKDVPIKKWCASKHTGLLNSCLGKLCLHPYLVVPLRSARVTLISTRVSAHCHAILLAQHVWQLGGRLCRCRKTGWRPDMKTDFVSYWPFVRGIHRWPVDFPHKGPVTQGFDVSFDVSWTSCWTNGPGVGGLKRHDDWRDITVMTNKGPPIHVGRKV